MSEASRRTPITLPATHHDIPVILCPVPSSGLLSLSEHPSKIHVRES